MYAHHMQNSMSDCGIAALLTVLDQLKINPGNFAKNYNQSKDINQQGLTIQNINDILKLYGITSDGYIVENFQELRDQIFPMIVIIEQEGMPHYVVIHEITDDEIIISNPSNSEITKESISDFLKTFSNQVICIESIGKTDIKDNFTDKLYNQVLKKVALVDKVKIVFLTLFQLIIPIIAILFIEYIISQKLDELTINKVLSILFLYIPLLALYNYANNKSAEIRVTLTNRLQKEAMDKYYLSELEDPSFNKNISQITGYFWNLMTAINGVIQLFYLKVDILYGFILLVALTLISPYSIPIIAFWAIIFVFIVRRNANDISNLYSSTLTNSNVLAATFQDNVKSSGDINSFNKKENAFHFFQRKMETFFSSNISLIQKDIKMNTWIQIFNVLISLSYFVLFFTFFKIGRLDSLESLGNGLLLLYLVTSNLQQIYSSWMTFRKSKNAISYIEDERQTFNAPVPKDILPISLIDSIEIKNLFFSYGDKEIFQDAAINFEKGKIYGIHGDNGTGKSTLINIILGFLREQNIGIKINGTEISTFYGTTIIDHISYYSTDMNIYNNTVANNVNFSVFDNKTGSYNKNQLNVNLPDNYVIAGEGSNISIGQKQKILLMRTLNRNREIYIFDEPTGNLDIESTNRFLNEISLFKDKIVILVSHQSILLNKCDVIYEIKDGVIHEE